MTTIRSVGALTAVIDCVVADNPFIMAINDDNEVSCDLFILECKLEFALIGVQTLVCQ
jgi:hypothetical protein